MKCKVDDCGRDANYKAAELCQKHYFRQRRYGTTDTTRTGHAMQRVETPQGYQWIYQPDHPLKHKNGSYVAEHRAVLYAAIGPDPMACELCGVGLTWNTVRVDHIDNNPRNNERSNLRPTCNTCNTRRGIGPAINWSRTHVVEFDGEVKTPAEWARDPRVKVTGRTIVVRLQSGMTAEQALFAPKVTHNGNLPKPYQPKTRHKHERKNAVRVEIDGVLKTAAEWARHPDCNVSMGGIVWRLKQGWSHRDAVFQPGRQ